MLQDFNIMKNNFSSPVRLGYIFNFNLFRGDVAGEVVELSERIITQHVVLL